MLKKALNIIRGIAKDTSQISADYLPKLGNILEKGINIAHDIAIPEEDRSQKSTYEKGISLAHKFLVRPSSNAAYGVGTWGPYELAPAFIGDRQEIDEDFEIIQRNPTPKLLTLPKKSSQTKKSLATRRQVVNSRRPVEKKKHVLAPKKHKKKKKYRVLV